MSITRETRKIMKKEKKKGSFPLEFVKMEFSEKPYVQLHSKEEMYEAIDMLLRVGKYKEYAQSTVTNNIYMNYDIIKNGTWLCRTKSIIEREEIRAKLRIRASRLHPDFENRKVVTETAKCYFKVDKRGMDSYKFNYKGQNTHAFPMSDIYLLGLYVYCEDARKNFTQSEISKMSMSDFDKEIVGLSAVRNGIFKCLLLDDMKEEDGMYVGYMRSILLLE